VNPARPNQGQDLRVGRKQEPNRQAGAKRQTARLHDEGQKKFYQAESRTEREANKKRKFFLDKE
jgi:hypothetical protein